MHNGVYFLIMCVISSDMLLSSFIIDPK